MSAGEIVDWLDRRILDIPAARIASIKVTGDDGAMLTLEPGAAGRTLCRRPTRRPIQNSRPAALAEPAGALAALDLADVKPAADQPMPDSGVATASFTTFDGLTIDVRAGLEGRQRDWLAIAASGQDAAEAEAKAINAKLGGWSYAMTQDRAKLLRTRLADLVEPPKGS